MSFEVRPPSLPLPSRLEVFGKLGAGAFGSVYEVYDREQQCRVALKSLERLDPHSLFRFKREFRELADITHPNLVRLHELFCFDDRWYFTMDLIHGVSFIEHVRPGYRLPSDMLTVGRPDTQQLGGTAKAGTGEVSEAKLRAAALQLTEGVGALHSLGKLHRDLKPQNVLVREDGRVIVLDFGLVDDIGGDTRSVAEPYELVGTPAYMAPEAAAGQSDGAESDWYSVGVMLYEALTGQLPYAGKPISMLLRKQTSDPEDPSPLVPRSLRDLARLAMRLLARSPEERPSFLELRAALEPGSLDATGGIRRSDPSHRESDPTSYLTRQPTEFLIGRELHLEFMTNAFKTVRDDHGVLLRVFGPSGLGKSAMVRFFVDDLRRSRQAVVLFGRCFECESVPYKALDSLVDALAQRLASLPMEEVAPLLPPDLVPVTRLFPVLRRVSLIEEAVSDDEPEGADPHEIRRAAFAALRAIFSKLAERKPLVLWIDDLQWGDQDSVSFLVELLQPPDVPKLLLIVSHRSEDAPTSAFLRPFLSSLPKAQYQHLELEVGPLSGPDCERLATLLAREQDGRASQPPLGVAEESGGSPLFLMQLVRHSSRAGGADAHGRLEVRLDDVLWEHVSSLSEPAQRLLQVTSLAGRSIELAVARTAANVNEELRDSLDTLRMQRLVRTQGMRGTDLVEPYHDRIRAVVAANLDPDVRRELHRALAVALEASGRADPETLIVHHRGAGNTELAWKCAVSAGDRAASALAFRRAADLYLEALEFEPDRETHQLRLKLADALANAGHGAEASETYLAAVETAAPGEALELRRKAAEAAFRVGHVDEGLAILEDMLAAAGMKLAGTPSRALMSLLTHRAWLRVRGFGYRGRYELDPEALRRIDIGWALVVGLSNSDAIRGADIQTRTLLLALETGEPSRIARGLALEAAMVATNGPKHHKRVAKLLDASAALADKLGDPYPVGWTHCAAGAVAYFEGRFQACVDRSVVVLKLWANTPGVSWERTTAKHYANWSLIWLGQVREAKTRVHAQLKEAFARGDLYSATDLRLFTTNVAWLVDDDVAGARSAVEDAISPWTKRGFHAQHYYAIHAQVQIELYVGDGVAGLEIITQAWPALDASMLRKVQCIKIETLHLRARCALAAAQQDPTRKEACLRMAEADAQKLAKECSVFAPAMGELTWAGVASLRGDEQRCIRHLRAALEGFEKAGMMQYAAAAARRLGAIPSANAEREAAEANERMEGETIRDIERWTNMLAPGFN